MKNTKIDFVKPLLPEYDKYCRKIKEVWNSNYLTNNGPILMEFEGSLSNYFGVKSVSTFCNGHLALEAILHLLPRGSEVITTPYTFASTIHAICNQGLIPVFCDIEKNGVNIDAENIQPLVTEKTSAILGVHVFGFPCNIDAISKIAITNDIKVIYDAAHAFGVKIGAQSLLSKGDYAMCSFHATKVYNSVEGGCVILNTNQEDMSFVELFKNFGLESGDIISSATNGKMNEFQATMGLLNLENVDRSIQKRIKIASQYNDIFHSHSDIRTLSVVPEHHWNASYYPIFVPTEIRDSLCDHMLMAGLICKPYFSPSLDLSTQFKKFASDDYKNAQTRAAESLCLPIYESLTETQVAYVAELVIEFINGR